MKLAQAVGVLLAGGTWSVTRLPWAGDALVRALASDDETVRTMAGMLLVRAGPRSGALLERAARTASPARLPMILRVLGDVGDSHAAPLLKEYAASSDADVAEAARDAMAASALAGPR